MNTASYTEALDFALESNRSLRDDNFVTPDAVLLFTETTGELEEVELWDLPFRFPLGNPGMRWDYSNLGELIEAKATLYRQSVVANELADEDPYSQGLCGTVVVVDPIRPGPLNWARITAPISATESPAH
jgi:hypothetical protein